MYRVRTLPQLSFEQALKLAFSRLTQFNGRSRRSEFWWCSLAAWLVNLIASWIPFIGGVISFLISLALIPLTFRRLHDTGRSGWWWGFGCIIGTIGATVLVLVFVGAFSSVGHFSSASAAENYFKNLILNPFTIIYLLVIFAYSIMMLVFLCQDSEKRPNQYGASPKYLLFKV